MIWYKAWVRQKYNTRKTLEKKATLVMKVYRLHLEDNAVPILPYGVSKSSAKCVPEQHPMLDTSEGSSQQLNEVKDPDANPRYMVM